MNLSIENLNKKYGQDLVLKDISFSAEQLKSLAIIGASGSGKSTLLRLIAGLEPFNSGSIIVNEHNLKQTNLQHYRKRIGFVFQDHNLFPHLTIEQNIHLVLEKVQKKDSRQMRLMVDNLLNQFGLYGHKHKYPREISGGQSQRASIVRALSLQPDIILLDEPTSSLDPILTYEVLSAISDLSNINTDFILVTHEIGFAKQAADYIIFMEDGQIIEHGDSSLFSNPQTERLQFFLSKVLSYNT